MTTKVNLPESWQRLRLKDCLDSLSSGARPTGGSEAGSGEVFSLGGEHINDQGGFDWSNPQYVPWSFYESIREDAEVAVNDILINKDGAKTGKLAIVREGFPHGPCCINEHVFRLRADTELADPRFLFYSLLAHHGQTQITRTIQGSAQGGINKTFAKQVYVSFPTQISEQHCIADVLVLTDDAIAAAEAKLTAARRLKTALMQQLFTRGIPGQHEEFQRTKWFEAPASWQPRTLRQIADVEAGFTMGRDLSGYETVECAYLTVVNVQEGRFDLSDVERVVVKQSELDGLLLRPGDILMTEGGDRDKLGRGGLWRGEIEPCVYQNHVFRVRFAPDTYRPELFHFLLQTWHAKNYFYTHAKQTSNLCTINSRELKRFPLFEPPPDEQEEMIELLSTADAQVTAVEGEITSLHRLKRSLLQNLLTGRVRVRMEAQSAREQMPLFSSR